MNEPGLDRRSLTPCLDENGVDDDNCCLENSNSKEIELSDISDIEIEDDESWQCSKGGGESGKANGNDSKSKESSFKKITRNTRGRNYRDNVRGRKQDVENFQHRQPTHQPYRRFSDNKRRDLERYNVRSVVASREFSISRSRSRSPRSFTPKPRDTYRSRRKLVSPAYYRTNHYKSPPPRKYSPPSSRHSRSPSMDRYRSYQYRRSPTPEVTVRRSRSRHKTDKNRELNFC